jgi:arylsulfatase
MTRRDFTTLLAGAAAPARRKRPNLVVILADDLGYSDIGAYGGEIATPNLDRLASRGIRFSQFYNCARCCPTRASLLTGLYPHQAGVGHMIQNRGLPPYQGYLNRHSVTLAEALKPAGYTTLMSGKWHVGENRPHWPTDRGFDQYFGLISGASSYFELSPGRQMALNDKPFTPEKGNFYMTNAITDHAVSMVRAASSKPNPYLLYLAYTSPHWPLHALPGDIDKYRGKYMLGWDRLRQQRHERQLAMGLVDSAWGLSLRDHDVPAWDTLSQAQKQEWDLRMAVYAAQVDRMDQGIGRVLGEIEKSGQMDDTFVLFLADNGGCAEENIGGEKAAASPVPGPADSFTSYRKPWANASNTPFRLWKQRTHEGGISTPAIAAYPRAIRQPGAITHETGHLIDIMPTLLDVAGAGYPETHKGETVQPMEGVSLTTCLIHAGGVPRNAPGLFWEHQGHKAFRQGSWKLVAGNKQPWELYNLAPDRCESNDLAARDPQRVQRMVAEWQRWADRCGVAEFGMLPKAPAPPAR